MTDSPHPAPHLSVVLPVYRNAPLLEALHERLRRVAAAHRWQVQLIFVNDGCPAGSLAVLARLVQQDPDMIVVDLVKNVGQHRAVLTGLSYARADRILIMDADIQDPPEAIGRLMAKLSEGFSAVFAGRRGDYEAQGKLFTSRVFKQLLHITAGVPPDAGMFVLFNRETARRLGRMTFLYPFVVAMIGCTGLPLTSIPVKRNVRPVGTSAYRPLARLKIGCLTLVSVIWWRSTGGWPDRPDLNRGQVKQILVAARPEPSTEMP